MTTSKYLEEEINLLWLSLVNEETFPTGLLSKHLLAVLIAQVE